MKPWLRLWIWPLGKVLLALAILAGVGRQFYADLNRPDLEELQFRWPFAVLSAIFYLIGLGFSGGFWLRLLTTFNQKTTAWRAFRAYYVGQLGKYVPGKAVALLMRGTLVAGPDVRLGVAILTAFYEVLTTMAAGALVAAVVFIIQPPEIKDLPWHPVYTGLLLLGLVGLPLLPGVFNLMMTRLARRFALIDSYQMPKMRGWILTQGLLLTGVGWIFLGGAVWAILAAVLPEPPPLTLAAWTQCMGGLGLAYVAGFLAFVMPGGVGVREFFLLQLLGAFGPDGLIAAAVLLLRLVWTGAELALAGVLFLLPGRGAGALTSDRRR